MPDSEINFEGSINGELNGSVYATMNFRTADGKDGNYTLTSLVILSNGDIVGASGRGTTSHASSQQWNVAGVSDVSDTSSMAVKGLIDLENHSFTGELFERN